MTQQTDIRGFRWEDLHAATAALNRIAGAVGTEKETDSELLRQNLSVPGVEPETNLRLATVGSEIAGYYLLSPEAPIDRAVVAGGVLPEFRRRGIGRLLLEDAVARAGALGVRDLHIQSAADDGGAHRLLEGAGFRKIKDFWQMRWEGEELPPVSLGADFRVKPLELGKDEAAFTELQNVVFGENWGFCPNTVEQIEARVRIKNTPPDGVVLIMNGDRPAAYNWTLMNRNSHGGIGFVSMTGVHPSYRGKGLGAAIVVSGMESLRRRGVDAIELEVDAENVPARELYLKLGYRQAHHSVWHELRFG